MDTTTSAQFIEYYKDLLNFQASFWTGALTCLLSIFTIIGGATWLWNFVLVKRQIKSEVNSNFDKALDDHKKMISDIIDQKSEKMTNLMKNKVLELDANTSRSLGLQAKKDNILAASFSWWTRALTDYIELEDGEMIRICIKFLLGLEKLENFQKQLSSDIDFKEDRYIQNFNKIPDTLNDEKQQLIKIVKKIREKESKKVVKKELK